MPQQLCMLSLIICLLLLIALPIYITILVTVIKFRKKDPFDNACFKLVLSCGVFDLWHLSVNWIFVKFVHLGWFWLDRLVMLAPDFFAKAANILWCYTAFGQKLGVLLVAVNRVTVIVYDYDWTPNKMMLMFIAHWTIPLFNVVPEFWLQYKYINDSSQHMIIQWDNAQLRWYYYEICTAWCAIVALLCGFCYGKTFYKTRKHRMLMAKSKITKNSRSRKAQNPKKTELKLALVGCSMSVLTGICAIFCAIMISVKPVDEMEKWMPFQDILFDIYAWINAYLLLACSKKLRKHCVATLFCKNVNQVSPVAVK